MLADVDPDVECVQFRTGHFKILPVQSYIFYRFIKEHLQTPHLSLHFQTSKFVTGQIVFPPTFHLLVRVHLSLVL